MDAPKEINRTFIREALDRAAAEIGSDSKVTDSPRIDSGMEHVAGTPEVATVMFDKIRESAIFVGDVSLVGEIKGESGKKRSPNPNVSLEMGYAAGVIGWSRVICVMNEVFGKRTEAPFDVRNRRFPIDYTLKPSLEGAEETQESLMQTLKTAIQTISESELRKADEAIKSLDQSCLHLMSIFRDNEFSEEFIQSQFPKEVIEVFLRAIPRLLDLRLIWTNVAPEAGKYSYRWTYTGTLAVRKLIPVLQSKQS